MKISKQIAQDSMHFKSDVHCASCCGFVACVHWDRVMMQICQPYEYQSFAPECMHVQRGIDANSAYYIKQQVCMRCPVVD